MFPSEPYISIIECLDHGMSQNIAQYYSVLRVKYAKSSDLCIGLQCSDVATRCFRSSEAETWTDATELGLQDATRLDLPFEHGLSRSRLHVFDTSVGPMFRVLRWKRPLNDSSFSDHPLLLEKGEAAITS